MSQVSNWILIADEDVVLKTNKLLYGSDDRYGEGFRPVPSEQGGNKLMDVVVSLAAFNYADIDLVIGVVKDIVLRRDLDDDRNCLLLLCDHDDMLPRIVFCADARG